MLKFQDANFPKEKYTFMHPTLRTVGSDLLIVVRHNGDGGKNVAIPVQKAFMARTIEFFKRKYDGTSNWKESKPSTDKVLVWEVPENICAQSVFAYGKPRHKTRGAFVVQSWCRSFLVFFSNAPVKMHHECTTIAP